MKTIESFEVFSFVRGVSERKMQAVPHIETVRQDRQPRDTPIENHQCADEWFRNEFGTRYRSQSVFVTGSLAVAGAYAKYGKVTGSTPLAVVRVLPLGPYSFCWSPKVRDLSTLIGLKGMGAEVSSILKDSGYLESQLGLAYEMGNEVMLACDRYVAIPWRHLEDQNQDGRRPGSALLLA